MILDRHHARIGGVAGAERIRAFAEKRIGQSGTKTASRIHARAADVASGKKKLFVQFRTFVHLNN